MKESTKQKFPLPITLYVAVNKSDAYDAVHIALEQAGINSTEMDEEFWERARFMYYEVAVKGIIDEKGNFTPEG